VIVLLYLVVLSPRLYEIEFFAVSHDAILWTRMPIGMHMQKC